MAYDPVSLLSGITLGNKSYRYASEYMHKNVHYSTIHNSPKLETSEISLKSRMDKYIIVYAYDRIINNKNEEPQLYVKNKVKSHKHNGE